MPTDEDVLNALAEPCRQRWQQLGFTTRTVAANGINFHVAEGGSGPPLVLLHGYPQSGEIWRAVAPTFAQHRRVIVPDLRGMGLSAIAANGYELLDLAEDIHRLVITLGFTEVDVIGHDWGAAVGAVYAMRYRNEVKRLAVIEGALAGAGFEQAWTFNDPNPPMTFVPLLLSGDLAEQLIADREEIYLRHLWRTFTANAEGAPFHSWAPYVAAMKRPGLIRSSANYYRAVYEGRSGVRELLSAGRLSVPVLSIAGEQSLGVAQRMLVEAFASNVVKHVVIDNAGHFVAEEQPEALLSEVEPFLALDSGCSASA